ncbi:MAG TPA: hypothetical protein VFY81_08010 [Gammaproteobacteria bacterium]|nr:hypothetical protein [Gammaproteobacteria bacterium]
MLLRAPALQSPCSAWDGAAPGRHPSVALGFGLRRDLTADLIRLRRLLLGLLGIHAHGVDSTIHPNASSELHRGLDS